MPNLTPITVLNGTEETVLSPIKSNSTTGVSFLRDATRAHSLTLSTKDQANNVYRMNARSNDLIVDLVEGTVSEQMIFESNFRVPAMASDEAIEAAFNRHISAITQQLAVIKLRAHYW